MYWKKFQVSKLNEDNIIYKKHQNKGIKEIQKAKTSFERKLSLNIKSDPKSFYAYVFNKSNSKQMQKVINTPNNYYFSSVV